VTRGNAVRWVLAGITVIAAGALIWWTGFDHTEPRELTILKSVVRDVEDPSPSLTNLRAMECDGWVDRATKWRKANLPSKLVDRFASACSKVLAPEH
jgi:hypothetical protein